jgi:hypothetical protein
LLTNSKPLTPQELDAAIEAWLVEKTGTTINFDIQGPLQNLQKIQGCTDQSKQRRPLLKCDDRDRCHVLPLEEAREVLDYVWDNAFHYSGLGNL